MLFEIIPLLLSIILPTVLCVTHDIVAGEDGKLAFVPSVTHASPGDTLIFHFYPGHHNVAQGIFNQPCQPSPGGFYSGYVDPDQGEDKTTFEVKVNSTDPLWIYCSAPAHCENGMVGVINPPSNGDQTLDAYAKAAQSASGSGTPDSVTGGVFSNGDSSSQSSASASASASSSSAASSSMPASSASSSSASASASAAATSASGSGSASQTTSSTTSATASGSAASTSPTGAAVHGFGAANGALGAVGMVVVFVGGWMGLL